MLHLCASRKVVFLDVKRCKLSIILIHRVQGINQLNSGMKYDKKNILRVCINQFPPNYFSGNKFLKTSHFITANEFHYQTLSVMVVNESQVSLKYLP